MQNTPQGGAPQPGGYPGGYPGGFPGGQAPQPQPQRSKKWYWIGGGIALAIVLCCGCAGITSLAGHNSTTDTQNSVGVNSSGGGTTTSGPAPTATTAHVAQWTTVQKFSGTTSQKTPLFTVPGEWRIVWKCQKANEFGGNFIVGVMNADGSPLDFAAVNTQGNDGATTYEHQGDGQIYLDVQTYSEQWSIEVQVQK